MANPYIWNKNERGGKNDDFAISLVHKGVVFWKRRRNKNDIIRKGIP